MCSSTRGPAIWPSLVTWPTMITVRPVRLANPISAWAAARTWATVPGAESSSSAYMVWIESMTTKAGLFAGLSPSRVAITSLIEVAARSATEASPSPVRSARIRS